MYTIVRIINWACVSAAFAVPALIAVRLFKNAISDGPRRTSIIFKATAALAVWIIATIALLFITFVVAYATHGFYQSAGWHPTSGYFGLHLGYLLIGCGLVYWVWRRARIKSP